jgi:signal transduction histidine kinase
MLAPRTTGETVRAYGDTFWRKDGSKFRVAYSSAPLPTSRGRGAVVVFRDVTRQMEDEEAARNEAVERARAEEIHASRARIVAAADAERRRLVRDLHDGAQQRLVRILLGLRLARDALGAGTADPSGNPVEGGGAGADAGPAGAEARRTGAEAGGAVELAGIRANVDALLEQAFAETRAAIAELRDLGSGIHPQILTNRGVAAAVESLTAPLPLPVDLRIPRARFQPTIEAAAYFVIAEALTNVIKHAAASAAAVTVAEDGGQLVIEVSDDGCGGATIGSTGGLAGLQDRVAALSGSLTLAAAAPVGTLLRATLPALSLEQVS